MLVLERIESSCEQDIRFVFPAGEHEGEHYAASLSFCPNPVCGCGILGLSVVRDMPEEASDASRPEFRFNVDILEQKLDTANAEASTYGKNLGKAFVSHLERNDWALLHELFYLHKRQLTDTTPDEQLDTYFPSSEIERDGAMVGFREILPFGEYRTLELDGKRYVLDDQHCVRPGCECTESVVSLLDEQARNPETAPSEYPTIFVDYGTGRGRIVERGGANLGFLERFAKEMKSGDYPAWFRKRHSRLKSLYRLYKQRHVQPASRPSPNKLGRNDPCPCGSGKKYKKCCLGKQ